MKRPHYMKETAPMLHLARDIRDCRREIRQVFEEKSAGQNNFVRCFGREYDAPVIRLTPLRYGVGISFGSLNDTGLRVFLKHFPDWHGHVREVKHSWWKEEFGRHLRAFDRWYAYIPVFYKEFEEL